MPKNDSNQPPAGALTLRDAFWRFTEPTLIETLRQLETAGANVPPREAYRSAWMNDGVPLYSTTNPRWREYRRARQAAETDFFRRFLPGGDLSLWGRESLWDKTLIEVPAGTPLHIIDLDKAIVRGPKPEAKRLYGVVVAKRADAPKRGRKSLKAEDEPIVEEIRRMILADPMLSPESALWQLVDDGRTLPGVGSVKSRIDRIARRYRENYPA